MAYVYSVYCEDRDIVFDMARFDNADVLPWGDDPNGYLFVSFRLPTEARWDVYGVYYRIEHKIKTTRSDARLLLGRNEERILLRHPTTDFPYLLKPDPVLEDARTLAEAVSYPSRREEAEIIPLSVDTEDSDVKPLSTVLNGFLKGRKYG